MRSGLTPASTRASATAAIEEPERPGPSSTIRAHSDEVESRGGTAALLTYGWPEGRKEKRRICQPLDASTAATTADKAVPMLRMPATTTCFWARDACSSAQRWAEAQYCSG